MNNESLVKFTLIFGGGFLLFLLIKPKSPLVLSPAPAVKLDTVEPTKENAELVYRAYTSALESGESPSKLSELNKECLKEFGMTCSIDDGQTIVRDSKGAVMLTK